MVFVIVFGTFFGSLGTSSSANDTNTINTTNTTPVKNVNKMAASQSLTAMADPTPGTTGTNPSVSISVTPSVNLGNVIADGSEYSYPSTTHVSVSATEETPWFTSNNDKLNLYVKSSGDFISASDSIPLSNFRYDGFSNSGLSKTSFTTDYVKVNSWGFTYTLGLFVRYWSSSANVNGNYYLTVPAGSAAETYTTTVYYMAVIQLQ